MKEKDIDFIAEYYSDDVFSPEKGWRKFTTIIGVRRKRFGTVAAAVAVIALSASAAIFTYNEYKEQEHQEHHLNPTLEEERNEEIRVVTFEKAKLSKVVDYIESEYGVKIGNVPSNSEDYLLTLRFEGTPDELIDAINEILGTQLILESE